MQTPKRRWFRFSLRTLLVVVTIASAGFGWLGIKCRQARQQEEAVEAIRKLGGDVAYDYEFALVAGDPPTAPGPAWLRRFLGNEFFASVVYVTWRRELPTSAGLKHLRTFGKLKELDLVGPAQFKEDGLAVLGELTQLESLNLNHTNITDAGLTSLKKFKNLKSLFLDKTQVTDAGLVHLQQHTQLQILRLDGADISDAGVNHLQAITSLTYLSMDRTKLTDAGLSHLQKLTHLTDLLIGTTRVTDDGLVQLQALTQLETLYLNNTQVTDAGLVHLQGLKQLKHISLQNTWVTDDGCNRLLKNLPNLSLTH